MGIEMSELVISLGIPGLNWTRLCLDRAGGKVRIERWFVLTCRREEIPISSVIDAYVRRTRSFLWRYSVLLKLERGGGGRIEMWAASGAQAKRAVRSIRKYLG